MADIAPIQAHLCVKGGLEAIEFYKKAFGASDTFHELAEDGKRVMHATLSIYGGEVMLHDEFPEYEMSIRAPTTVGGASVAININLKEPDDVDAAYDRAIKAGATKLMEPQDTFWGARYARILDPFGHIWAFNTSIRG